MHVTAELINRSAESLIERRDTHLDQLSDKLQGTRVRHVMELLLSGESDPEKPPLEMNVSSHIF